MKTPLPHHRGDAGKPSGDLNRAHQIVDAAAKAGVNVIKLLTLSLTPSLSIATTSFRLSKELSGMGQPFISPMKKIMCFEIGNPNSKHMLRDLGLIDSRRLLIPVLFFLEGIDIPS
jgi:hypothetical protein